MDEKSAKEPMASTAILNKNRRYSPTVLPDGSCILFDTGNSHTVALTAPAGIFWELCDGRCPVTAIVEEVQRLYPEAPFEIIQRDRRD